MYSGKLLMMSRGTTQNMLSLLKNWEISASVDFIKMKYVSMFGRTALSQWQEKL